MADQVVAGLEGFGDLARPLQRIQYNSGTPVLAVRVASEETHLVDLEPVGALTVAGRESAGARVHPHHHGTLRVRPLLPHRRNVLARGDLRRQRRARPAVAGHLGVRHRHDRVVVGPLALDDLRAGLGGETLFHESAR